MKCFYFTFLGGDLRVTYNFDMCKKSRPPFLGLKNSQIDIGNFLFVFEPNHLTIIKGFPQLNLLG